MRRFGEAMGIGRIHGFDIRTGVYQKVNRLKFPAHDGKQKRSGFITIRCIGIGACRKEHCNDGAVSFKRGFHQRSLPVCVGCVAIGIIGERGLDRGGIIILNRGDQVRGCVGENKSGYQQAQANAECNSKPHILLLFGFSLSCRGFSSEKSQSRAAVVHGKTFCKLV
jgi:hypothetical protein